MEAAKQGQSFTGVYKGVIINFIKFTGKHLFCLFLVTLQAYSTTSLKRTRSQEFSCELYEIFLKSFPANVHLFKVNNRNNRKRCKICSKLTIKIPERRH